MINVKCVEALKSVSDNLFQRCRFQATFTLVPSYSNYIGNDDSYDDLTLFYTHLKNQLFLANFMIVTIRLSYSIFVKSLNAEPF